ncbi:TIR domain-containing protein [Halomonas chromatireducens]|uniref:Putative nucleotide-binding protein containing TIR-like domain protein n=1 Tax=Halomonas chromatireducens TaxID=507626 RepID=A0A125R0B0_9GAMM|nr:nucleotide-binding protein [Halomonas chromatireducens]AMD01601.1 putative nucleotide-binding protein containing TIR-like domain protein [Halomonas chromatireducens]
MGITKQGALDRLSELRSRIPSIIQEGQESTDYFRWRKDAEAALVNFFSLSEGKRHLTEFKDIHSQLPPRHVQSLDLGVGWKTFDKAMELSSEYFKSVEQEIQDYYEDEAGTPRASVEESAPGNVFIVHGRDQALKEAVARFVAKIGLNPIILHEQTNEGRTLIEKFEANASADFAIALFTPDDVGGLKSDTPSLSNRARQNVLFEFGYFLGRLGRRHACALVQGEIELPSDYSGVVFIPVDSAGHWKFELLRELKAAGFSIDANRAL